MTKHTPEPWEVDEQEGVVFNRELGINICSVYPFNRKANAHLIAAAPDLLEACQSLIEWLNEVGEVFPGFYETQIRQAIAKAKGE